MLKLGLATISFIISLILDAWSLKELLGTGSRGMGG